jgi:hypothetical protein
LSEILDELLNSIDQAIAALKATSGPQFTEDAENLLRIRRILEGLDPDEIEALLETDEEE